MRAFPPRKRPRRARPRSRAREIVASIIYRLCRVERVGGRRHDGAVRHEARQFASRADAELPVDPGQVRLDGGDAHEERLPDLAVPHPLRDQGGDAPLGRRQLTCGAARSGPFELLHGK